MAAKKREIYARIAVQLRTHDRARIAERKCNGAMGLYAFLLIQARGEQTGGDVSELAALESWGAPNAYRKRQVEALIASGLVERVGDRLHITKYGEHNDTPEDIESAKSDARVRMRELRENRSRAGDVRRTEGERSTDVPISYSLSESDLGSREGVQGEPTPPKRELSMDRYQAAYAAGVSRGKGSPWVWPGTKYAEWDLGKIIKGHAKDPKGHGYRGDQLLRFLEHTAAEFASQVFHDQKSQYYSSFEPRGCLKWLNEQGLAEEARRVG